jgi:cysteine-rich repeat protein
VLLEDEDSRLQQQGGTEGALPEKKSDAELMRLALAVTGPPPPLVERDDDQPGQRVVVDGVSVVVVRGGPVLDTARFTCGALCALVGDRQALGWSYATKRPVHELLFGRPAVCGDFLTDPGEACDDGNRADGDGCDASCAQEDPRHSLLERLDIWLAGALVGLGRIGNTLLLSVPSLVLAMLASLALGVIAGLRGGRVDAAITFGAAVVSATPAFFVALLLVTLFAEELRWLPSSGVFRPGVHQDGAWAVVVDRARHAALPVCVLTLFWSGRFVRQVRSAVVAALASDAIRTARMIGATEWRVVRVHVLPNAALPLVTLVGLSLPSLFGGALLTETVFSWPGLGRLQYDAILQNDSYVAIVVFLLSAAMVLMGSLFADVAAALLDPRLVGRRR